MPGRELRQLTFDYGDLEPDAIDRCEQAIEAISQSQRRVAGEIIAIGRELLAVKDQLEHGQFGPWLQYHFGWTHETARRMMNAARTFGENPQIVDFTIDQSALYLLSSDKCDDDTREAIMERAEAGERITHAMVKAALDPEPEPEDEDEPEEDLEPEPEDEDDDVDLPDAPPSRPPVRAIRREKWDRYEVLRDLRQAIDGNYMGAPKEHRGEVIELVRSILESLEQHHNEQ